MTTGHGAAILGAVSASPAPRKLTTNLRVEQVGLHRRLEDGGIQFDRAGLLVRSR